MTIPTSISKRLLLLVSLIMPALCAVKATEENESQQTLPILKITVDGSITKDMDYTNGTMQLTDEAGNVVELKAMFRTRGATARSYTMKPSLNMKLRTDDYSASQDSSLLGMRSKSKWILDAMPIDRICMRNRVAMDIWNAYATLPYATDFGSRSGTEGRFIEMYINGEYKGIYCLSDDINRKLLNLKKYDEKKQLVRGVLYKSGTSDIANQDERNFTSDWKAGTISWHNAWELKEPEDYECEAAWQPLIDLYDNRTTYDDVKKYFFLNNLVDYQLHIMALAIQDNWGNKNHFFSIRNIQKDIDDPDSTESARRKTIVSPWDLDTSLGGKYDGSAYDGNGYSDWEPADIVKNGGCYPFYICQGQTEYMELLKKRWAQLRTTTFSKDSINARLESYRDLFLNSGAWQRMTEYFDAQSSKPCYVEDLAKEIGYIEEWYSKQYDLMDAYFGIDTGITTIHDSSLKSDDAIYSIQGIRLHEVPAKGLYIQGGKLRMK
jgi:hypothetical protein